MCIYGLVMVTQIQQFYVCYLCGSIDVAKHFHPSAPPGRSFGAWELARPCECSGILATFGAKQSNSEREDKQHGAAYSSAPFTFDP